MFLEFMKAATASHMEESYWMEIAALGRYGRQGYGDVRKMTIDKRHRLYDAVREIVDSENSRDGGRDPFEDMY